MADGDESVGDSPDATVDVFHDGSVVEAIHSTTGVRGHGGTEIEAIHQLSVNMADRGWENAQPDDGPTEPEWRKRGNRPCNG